MLLGISAVVYLVDATGSGTMTVEGRVVDAANTSLPVDSFTGRTGRSSESLTIAIPGRTFTWTGPFQPGQPVEVEVAEGRITKRQYVKSVRALSSYEQAMRKLRDKIEEIRENREDRP